MHLNSLLGITYFSSLILAGHMDITKVIQYKNGLYLEHWKEIAPLLLIIEMCDDQGVIKTPRG